MINEKKMDDILKQDVDLLHTITRFTPKGCIKVVMDPSDTRKSTLLDGLAGQIARRNLKGRVSLDVKDMNPSSIKRTSAYIMQDDLPFSILADYETLMFAADFQQGPISRFHKFSGLRS